MYCFPFCFLMLYVVCAFYVLFLILPCFLCIVSHFYHILFSISFLYCGQCACFMFTVFFLFLVFCFICLWLMRLFIYVENMRTLIYIFALQSSRFLIYFLFFCNIYLVLFCHPSYVSCKQFSSIVCNGGVSVIISVCFVFCAYGDCEVCCCFLLESTKFLCKFQSCFIFLCFSFGEHKDSHFCSSGQHAGSCICFGLVSFSVFHWRVRELLFFGRVLRLFIWF